MQFSQKKESTTMGKDEIKCFLTHYFIEYLENHREATGEKMYKIKENLTK